ncbi:MAG: nucleoside hydrolase [Clostridia bacterium]|nr:nucleoside hydrolase [Clostridia bacterium]
MTDTRKFIFDTDIGDDIDDAFALALLLGKQAESVVGVTTVYRNTAARAQQAMAMLECMGHPEIPVYAGERFPLNREITPFFCEEKGGDYEVRKPCQWTEDLDRYSVTEGAVDFIIESAKKYGKDLWIVPVGALTNVAKAIEKAPEVMRGVGGVMQMGGQFQGFTSEWNIICDPEAADVVWSSGIPVYAVGLNVTLQCGLEPDLLDAFRASAKPHNQLLVKWLDLWFGFFPFAKSVMHDPLAVACLFTNPCTFEKVFVKVRDDGSALHTSDEKEGFSPIYAARAVDKSVFYALVKEVLL